MTESAARPIEPFSTDDVLGKIQLRVAQRADEIARARSNRTALNLDCWLVAEAEFFREAFVIAPSGPRA
jgi:hypothetical protein